MTRYTANPHWFLSMSNLALAGSSLALLLSFLVAYPYADNFSLATQIAAHLLIPVAAGFFKLGYVFRLASQEAIRKLGHSSSGAPA